MRLYGDRTVGRRPVVLGALGVATVTTGLLLTAALTSAPGKNDAKTVSNTAANRNTAASGGAASGAISGAGGSAADPGTGAASAGRPSTALSGASTTAALSALRVKVMTWNVCGDDTAKTTWKLPTGNRVVCSNTHDTAKMAKGIVGYMTAGGMLNNPSTTHLAIFQEICYADVVRLKTYSQLKNWNFRFLAVQDRGSMKNPTAGWSNRQCKNGRRGFGIAVGTDRATTFRKDYFNVYPHGDNGWGRKDVKQGVICGTITAAKVNFCGAHLTPRFPSVTLAQAKGLWQRAGSGGRVIVGGDLNGTPTSSQITPLYTPYTECDQAAHGGKHAGTGSFQGKPVAVPWNDRMSKLDYVFASKSAKSSCSVTANHVSASDHRPVIATVDFPAT